MKEYHTLTNAEKLEEMAKINFWRVHMYGNQAVIEDYESFGDSPHRIIENKAKYEQGLSVYGFTEKHLRKYGWLSEAEFLDYEEIVFDVNGRFNGTNSILLVRCPNGNRKVSDYGKRIPVRAPEIEQ
jgi:hypothetical protein